LMAVAVEIKASKSYPGATGARARVRRALEETIFCRATKV